MDETTFAEHLDALLSPRETGVDLSAHETAFLQDSDGVEPAVEDALVALDTRSALAAAAEVARTLTRVEVATLLGVSASRVTRLVAAGRLSFYRVAQRPMFPDWQFVAIDGAAGGGRTLPGLAGVLAAMPPGSHPLAVRTFMLTADDELTLAGRELSPREWLLSDGDAAPVVELARTLGEQV
ncbi:helix-turn-helix domain-containing protein [Nakamurella leprariae]|uniref:Helix-turn-helix domain-containing protein n=1 Tax=Nakamurella leprariae TaxID=2803911 RepID=A0A938YJ77_9ACTN|nr:helix-turn-helix domain-containing protein [Nakamurella leprariae]MBM9468785.1 helix-turn-helix domain-containing protein [Nakamurella leprariae]